MRSTIIHHLGPILLSKQLRFVGAGIVNTLIDFTVFNMVLRMFGAELWLANICSTTVAMVVSFAINKKAVFGDNQRYSHQQFLAFVLVTAVGLWGLQTLMIIGLNNILAGVAHTALHIAHNSLALQWLLPNIAKGVATIASAIWNYYWYDRVIFSKKKMNLSEWM